MYTTKVNINAYDSKISYEILTWQGHKWILRDEFPRQATEFV
jgi:hypothetical protein